MNKTEVEITKSITNFYNVSIWQNQWILISKHRFLNDAKIIEKIIQSGSNKQGVKAEIKRMHLTSLNEYIAPYFINF